MNVRGLTLAGVVSLCAVLAGVLVLACAPALAVRGYVPGVPSSFGSAGSGDGQFKEPTGVAVNGSSEPLVEPAAGDVYVLDTGNNRVERFSSAGVFIAAWGWGVGDGEAKYEVCTSGCRAGIAGVGAGQFNSSQAIAVDNSTSLSDPSRGDVYVANAGEHGVIDVFSSTGAYIRQVKETSGGVLFGELRGVAVNPSGDLWVYEKEEGFQGQAHVDEFSDEGVFIKALRAGAGFPGFAVDSLDDVYVSGFEGRVVKYDSTGKELAEFEEHAKFALAINPATNNLLVVQASSIALYGPFGEPYSAPLETFSGEGLSESEGIAVNGTTGTAYASQRGADNVEIFDYSLFPTVSTGAASPVAETSELLHGIVNPEGEELKECYFEYGTETSYGQSVPCVPSSATIGKENKAVPVSAEITGLEPRTTYHFRLVAANANGTKRGQDETFYISTAPVVEGESVSSVTPTGATVGAQVNAAGLPSAYHAEYVTQAQFTAGGFSAATAVPVPDADLGAPQKAVGVQVQLSGLQAGTAYHFRFVARNALGSTPGADMPFTTAQSPGASALSLPDERAYELVSPPGNGNVYVPYTTADVRLGQATAPEDSYTLAPFRAAAGGGAVVYVGDPPGSGVGGSGQQGSGKSNGNEYLAMRNPEGWTASDILPPPALVGESQPHFQAFSSDLSLGIFNSSDQPALGGAPANCNVLYSRSSSSGAFAALLTSTLTPGKCGEPLFAGASVDGSRSFFQSQAALTPGAVAASGPSNGELCSYDCNLYESVGGRLSLVNVLPGNGGLDLNATFGGPSGNTAYGQSGENLPDFSNAISADGSRVVWTDVSTNVVYVREDGASTVQVSAGAAKFWTASVDGRFVFYTEGEKLLRFDVDSGAREELAGAGVQGTVGVSEDGSYVYFVADGALASGATPQTCSGEGSGEGCNLYVLHEGEPVRFIATLGPRDNNIAVNGNNGGFGDWQANVGSRTAEVASAGRSVAFSSTRSLTGYDNRGVPGEFVYEYEAGGGRVFCVSCDPSGLPPTKNVPESLYPLGGFVVPSLQGPYTMRWVSDDGSRVFFDTAQPLVAQDTNGLVDVYEWERDGTGSCRLSGGCVYLLSGGTSTGESFFLDASASGGDVFFTTRAQLVPQDRDENNDLYDARVGGGFPQVAAPVCTGAGCQGMPPAPVVFATPSSVTFNGAGNLAPSALAVKPKPKSKPKQCRRGFARKHGRCVKGKTKKPGKHAKKGRK